MVCFAKAHTLLVKLSSSAFRTFMEKGLFEGIWYDKILMCSYLDDRFGGIPMLGEASKWGSLYNSE